MLTHCLKNGIGDQILDLLGILVLSDIRNDAHGIMWNPPHKNFAFGDGKYDKECFQFDSRINFIQTGPVVTVNALHAAMAMCPHVLYRECGIDMQKIIEKYNYYAEWIKISPELEKFIPDGLENAYGIHLRVTDKLLQKIRENDYHHRSFAIRRSDYSCLMRKIIERVKLIIESEDNPTFFITSERGHPIECIIRNITKCAKDLKKDVTIIRKNEKSPSLHGAGAVVDLFSLARCKSILKGTNFSTFTILAGLLSKNKKVEYFHNDYENSIFQIWSMCFGFEYDFHATEYVWNNSRWQPFKLGRMRREHS
jgi:hypothetical protein